MSGDCGCSSHSEWIPSRYIDNLETIPNKEVVVQATSKARQITFR